MGNFEFMTYAKLGINIGNDQIDEGSPDPTVQNALDLPYLKTYFTKVRVAIPYHLDTDGVNLSKALVLAAKAAGFRVIWGVTAGAVDTDANYNIWKNTSVPAAAAWAQANGVDEFTIGNEESWNASLGTLGTQTATDVRDDVRALCVSLRGTFTRTISYSDAEGTILGWDGEGIGTLDRLGINAYNTAENFGANIPYFQGLIGADKFYVSEWAAEGPYPSGYTDGKAYADDIASRLVALKTYDVEAYLFSWRLPADTVGSDNWAFKRGGAAFTPGWLAAIEQPRIKQYGTRTSATRPAP
jgi:hypothetical protein